MNWLTVRLPGGRLVYLPAGEQFEGERVSPWSERRSAADHELKSHARVRRVLWRLRDPHWKVGAPGWEKKSKSYGFLYSVLHWSDGTDLDELDRLVRSGEARESDFGGCVAGEPRTVRCMRCAASVDVVIVHTGDGPIGLADRSRVNGHKYYRQCPSCGQDERWPLVADFLNTEAWPSEWHVRAEPS